MVAHVTEDVLVMVKWSEVMPSFCSRFFCTGQTDSPGSAGHPTPSSASIPRLVSLNGVLSRFSTKKELFPNEQCQM